MNPLDRSGGQGRTDSRSESGQRSCPQGGDRRTPIRVNRTIDTRDFSRRVPDRRSVYIPSCQTEGSRMDSITALAGQLLGLWLAITGIAIVVGVLLAIGDSVSRLKRRRNGPDQGKTV